MLLIKWTTGDWKNWIDEIPDAWLVGDGQLQEVRHYCTDGRERLACVCSVTIRSKEITIEYGAQHREENLKGGIPAGRTKVVFADVDRRVVQSIFWADDDDTFQEAEAIWLPGYEHEAAEGDLKLVRHLRRERDPFLREAKINKVMADLNTLACEACDFDFSKEYGRLGARFCEVHHTKPLGDGAQRVAVSDLAILCANCHRMIHRTKPIMAVRQFRSEHVRKR